jgi:hypothetical protein
MTPAQLHQRGLGDLWQHIGGAIDVAGRAYGTYQQVRANRSGQQGQSLQAQMDDVWFQIQGAFNQLLSMAQGGPQAAAQALQQGAQIQAQYEAVKPQFSPLCCTQAQGVANRIAEWMARLQQMAGGAGTASTGGSVIAGTNGGAQTAGSVFNSNNLLLPALIIAAALFLKG